jgi:hypothetical protein
VYDDPSRECGWIANITSLTEAINAKRNNKKTRQSKEDASTQKEQTSSNIPSELKERRGGIKMRSESGKEARKNKDRLASTSSSC